MIVVSLLGLVALSTGLPVRAETVTGHVTVAAGALTLSSGPGPSLALRLDGTDRPQSTTFSVQVTDATGSGAGWQLQMTSTRFAMSGPKPRTLPVDALTVTGVTIACAQGTCTNPVNTVSYPLHIPIGDASVAPVTLVGAAPDSGMGSFIVTPRLEMTIPANAYAGAYTATMTLSIVSGP